MLDIYDIVIVGRKETRGRGLPSIAIKMRGRNAGHCAEKVMAAHPEVRGVHVSIDGHPCGYYPSNKDVKYWINFANKLSEKLYGRIEFYYIRDDGRYDDLKEGT